MRSWHRRLHRRSGSTGEGERWTHNHWPRPSLERFVISYPKSGRTWLRVMMAVAEAAARSAPRDEVVREWLDREAPSFAGERVLFTHALAESSREPAGATRLFLRYIGSRRRVFLVRDPRDVVVSYYFQTARRSARAAHLDLGQFVRHPDFGIDRALRYLRACASSLTEDPGPALLVTYEGLHLDGPGSLAAVLGFLGVDAPADDVVADAVDYAAFERMQGREREGAFAEANRRLVPKDPGDPESFKVRKGVVGGYRVYLSAGDVAFLEERIAALQPPELGYLEPGAPPPRSTFGAEAPESGA